MNLVRLDHHWMRRFQCFLSCVRFIDSFEVFKIFERKLTAVSFPKSSTFLILFRGRDCTTKHACLNVNHFPWNFLDRRRGIRSCRQLSQLRKWKSKQWCRQYRNSADWRANRKERENNVSISSHSSEKLKTCKLEFLSCGSSHPCAFKERAWIWCLLQFIVLHYHPLDPQETQFFQ